MSSIAGLENIPLKTEEAVIVHGSDGVSVHAEATSVLRSMISDQFWSEGMMDITPKDLKPYPHCVKILKKEDPSGNILARGEAHYADSPLALAAAQVFAHQDELAYNLVAPGLGHERIPFNTKTDSGITPDGIPYQDYIQCVHILLGAYLLVHVRNYEITLADGTVIDFFEKIGDEKSTKAMARASAPDKYGGKWMIVPDQLYGAYVLRSDGAIGTTAFFATRTIFGGWGFMDALSNMDGIIQEGFSDAIEVYSKLLEYRKVHPWS